MGKCRAQDWAEERDIAPSPSHRSVAGECRDLGLGSSQRGEGCSQTETSGGAAGGRVEGLSAEGRLGNPPRGSREA